jgi:orotate phosphoribosyltransferase
MSKTDFAAFSKLVHAREGHFALESGHHSRLWLDLDSLFADPRKVTPFVGALAAAIRPHKVTAVCGPLLGGAFLAQLVAYALGTEFCFTERTMPGNARGLYRASYSLPVVFRERFRGQRVAIVDDVMSAGSALRATYMELRGYEIEPVVAGALLVLGTAGEDFFLERAVAVEAVARRSFELWPPTECPQCQSGLPVEQVARRSGEA